jgi:hypothetical protein
MAEPGKTKPSGGKTLLFALGLAVGLIAYHVLDKFVLPAFIQS